MAQKLFVGLCLYLIETEKKTGVVPSMPAMLKVATPADGQSLVDWIKETVKSTPLSEACKTNMLSYVPSAGGQTGAGIISNFMAPLSVFSDPVVAGITSGDDFDLRDVRRKRMSIYVGINPNDFSRFGRLINLFFSQLISVNTDQLPEQNSDLKYQCLLIMDESISAQELETTPLEAVVNKDDLMQVVISALSAEDSTPEYLDDLKQAVSKAWQDSGTRAFEKVLGTT